MKSEASKRKLTANILIVILLLLALCLVTLALSWAKTTKGNHLFHTGTIKINLNDGETVIEADEYLFEPGMTVVKDFFIQNESTFDVYYKLYFDNVEGDLADILTVTITDGETVLYSGKARDLSRVNDGPADKVLHLNERQNLQIQFYYPAEADNTGQNRSLSFDLCADAVQTKNNPNQLFDTSDTD